jgi:nitroreductase
VNVREAHHKIDPIYIERWSPRAFSNRPVEEEKLNRIFEAARWAPSAANWQPWRFIIAKTLKDRERFLTFINENNVEWCQHAPVLMVIVSKKTRNEAGDPNYFHTFDTGTAWGYLTLEAARQGLITHGMGGFNPESAKEELNIPDEYDVQAVVAIGYHDPNAKLSARNQEREVPSSRIPMKEFVREGSF